MYYYKTDFGYAQSSCAMNLPGYVQISRSEYHEASNLAHDHIKMAEKQDKEDIAKWRERIASAQSLDELKSAILEGIEVI